MKVPSLVTYILAWAGTVGVIWFLFEKTEDTITTTAKNSISAWLKHFRLPAEMGRWPERFTAVFDHVFSERHFSIQCFVRSCLASSVFSFILFLAWKSQQEPIYLFFAEKAGFISSAIGALILLVFLNWLPDYLSLLETRYFLQLMKKAKSWVNMLSLLVLDFIVTSFIWIAGLWLFLRVGIYLQTNPIV